MLPGKKRAGMETAEEKSKLLQNKHNKKQKRQRTMKGYVHKNGKNEDKSDDKNCKNESEKGVIEAQTVTNDAKNWFKLIYLQNNYHSPEVIIILTSSINYSLKNCQIFLDSTVNSRCEANPTFASE